VVAKTAFDTDLASLREVVGAELCLLVPDSDSKEVGGVVVFRRAVYREHERGATLVVAELAQLDVRRQVSGQADRIHRVPPLLSLETT